MQFDRFQDSLKMFEEEEDYQRSIIPINQFTSLSLSEEELRAIFEAKCQDFRLKFDEKAFQRFLQRQSKHNSHKVLHMEGCGFGPIAASLIVDTVFQHSNLVVINFSSNFLGDEGAKCFADLIYNTQCIISMDLSSNHMTDSGLKTIFTALCTNKSMVDLNIGSKTTIGRNKIGPLTIQEITKMLQTNKVLSELNLQMTELNSNNIFGLLPGFETSKTLTSLNVSNNNIKSKGTIALFKSLMNSSLIELSIADNSVTDDIAPFFVSLLQNCQTLRKIDLSGNKLGFRLTSAISGHISSEFQLDTLILSRNPLGGRGISSFGPYLSHNEKLERLNVNGCQIDAKGFIEFCEELSKNESLKIIEIQHNPLSDDGIIKFSEAIVEHPTLKFVDLEMTELSDPGCKALMKSISSPTSNIIKLNLKNNLIHSGIIIQKALQDNTKILYLNIEFNNIEYKSTLDIQKLIQRNVQQYNANEKQRLMGRVFTANENAPRNIESRLIQTRKEIKELRIIIAKLEEDKRNLEKLLKETTEHRIKTINDLEELNAKNETEFINMQDDNRNQRHEVLQRTQDIEDEIGQRNGRLSREVEKLKSEKKNNSSLDDKVISFQKEYQNENNIILGQYDDAKDKYKEAKNLLIVAWDNLKNQKELESKKAGRGESKKKGKLKTSKKQATKKKSKETTARNDGVVEASNNNDDNKSSSSRSRSKNSTSKNASNDGSRNTARSSSKILSSKQGSAIESTSSVNNSKTPQNEEESQLIKKDDETFETQPPNTKVANDENNC